MDITTIAFITAGSCLIDRIHATPALVTDYVFGYDDAIRYSLSIVASVATSAAIQLLWMGLKPCR